MNFEKYNLVFVGGVHGVGKSTLCKDVAGQTRRIHLTASEVIRSFNKSALDSDNLKQVTDIDGNQDKLIQGLRLIARPNEQYILDGHFNLLSTDDEIVRVPLATFRSMEPKAIAVVTSTPEIVLERLKKRDGKRYEIELLRKMLTEESKYSREVAVALSVPFLEIMDDSATKLRAFLDAHFITNG